MENGYENERKFVEFFNEKKVKDLDVNSKKFIKELFDDRIDDDDLIICWKNNINQKADIFIKYDNYTKGISLKCGNSNSVHQENILEFKVFLQNLVIPYNIIDYYVSYHYGYDRDANGKTNFSIQMNSLQYKEKFQNEIDIFNKSINKTKTIIEFVDRFIIRGRNSKYDIDAFICGTVDDYVWILKDDIYDLILSKRNCFLTSPHFGCVTIGPKKRNLEHNPKNSHERFIVCGRWNNIRDDIIKFKSINKKL